MGKRYANVPNTVNFNCYLWSFVYDGLENKSFTSLQVAVHLHLSPMPGIRSLVHSLYLPWQ
jgi:hypothetical protein